MAPALQLGPHRIPGTHDSSGVQFPHTLVSTHASADPTTWRQARRLAVIAGLGAVALGASAAAVFLGDTGVAMVVAASAVVLSGLLVWIAHGFLIGQGVDRGMRARQTEIDLVRLQGDLVTVLRERQQLANDATGPEEAEQLRSELREAVDRREAMLRGLLKARLELATVERRAIATYLDEAASELQRLDQSKGSWPK